MMVCDTCGAPATHGVTDCIETQPGVWSETQTLRYGCASHPVSSVCHFADGRVLPAKKVIEEWPQDQISSESPEAT
jgi:hypothetical protein